ncbi:hypothetical protein QE152_g37344 [Popillia japonica]|uniref:Uncharacterized protein n=1 Tax=Popillia japonica TaxID=7064 RepID=A0AAW1IAW4_POPJA
MKVLNVTPTLILIKIVDVEGRSYTGAQRAMPLILVAPEDLGTNCNRTINNTNGDSHSHHDVWTFYEPEATKSPPTSTRIDGRRAQAASMLKDKPKVLILANDQGRNSASILREVLGDLYQVQCVFKPKALLEQVISELQLVIKIF